MVIKAACELCIAIARNVERLTSLDEIEMSSSPLPLSLACPALDLRHCAARSPLLLSIESNFAKKVKGRVEWRGRPKDAGDDTFRREQSSAR